MIPTRQTILHDPENGKHGNCFSAVLASLLHIDIETIPVFSDTTRWQRDLNAWLRPFGLAYIAISDFDVWADSLGIEGCYHEVAGNTSRSVDVLHACVGINGVVEFDPHPDGTGLTERTGHGLFIALRPWELVK